MKAQQSNPWGMTDREHAVVRCLVASGCRKRISTVLGIGIKTIDIHLQRARAKAGAANSLMLALMYDRLQRPMAIDGSAS